MRRGRSPARWRPRRCSGRSRTGAGRSGCRRRRRRSHWRGPGRSRRPGPGSGAGTLAFLIAAYQMHDEGTLIVIDPAHSFYPPAAANLGIDLERTVVVRPSNTKDTLWALEQTLRCVGVAVAVCHLEHLDDRSFRRLQLATETGGGIGLFLRADRFAEQPSWANVPTRTARAGSSKTAWPPSS